MKLKLLTLFALFIASNSFASTDPEARSLCLLITDNLQKSICQTLIEDVRFEHEALMQCFRMPSESGRGINICISNISDATFDPKIYQVLFKVHHVNTLNQALSLAADQVYTDEEISRLMACTSERAVVITLAQVGRRR